MKWCAKYYTLMLVQQSVHLGPHNFHLFFNSHYFKLFRSHPNIQYHIWYSTGSLLSAIFGMLAFPVFDSVGWPKGNEVLPPILIGFFVYLVGRMHHDHFPTSFYSRVLCIEEFISFVSRVYGCFILVL